MVSRAVAELRKNGMHDESNATHDWTAIQFWKVAESLCKHEEVSFDDVVIHPLFKYNTHTLLQMERAGLITCVHAHGRPYLIKPGRPIFMAAFREMMQDEKQVALMGAATNKQLCADYTKSIRDFETELVALRDVDTGSRWGFGSAVGRREAWLLKMIDTYAGKAQEFSDKEIAFKAKLKLE